MAKRLVQILVISVVCIMCVGLVINVASALPSTKQSRPHGITIEPSGKTGGICACHQHKHRHRNPKSKASGGVGVEAVPSSGGGVSAVN